jgi:FimV-like protein
MLGSAQALTLAPPVVLSKQGEALVAEADITEATIAEQIDLKATLASPELYQAAKVPLPNTNGTPVTLQVQLLQRSSGRPYLKITSQQPINGNALDVLIDLRWAGGRMLRDFNLLIEEAARNKSTATPPAVAGSGKRNADGQAINVKRGDTASEIAVQNNLPQGVSLDQMLLAMLRSNPDAFVDNNVNRLKAGALITLPTEEEVAAIDRKQAREDIRLQALDFDAYRAQLAGQVGKSKLADANERESKGGLKAQVDNKAQKSADQLTLSKPGEADADKVKQNLESEQAAQRNQEVAKNVTELDAISKAAGKMQDGLSSSMPNLPAGAQDFVAFLKRYMFELIGLIAVVAAILVSISLLRDKRRQQHKTDDDDTDLDFKSANVPSQDKPQDMKIDFDLDLPPRSAPSPVAPSPSVNAPSVNAPYRQTAPASSMPNANPLSEDPFQVRLDLADELWKLGQRQTGRALAQEVADQTHGETRERALRWLQERS